MSLNATRAFMSKLSPFPPRLSLTLQLRQRVPQAKAAARHPSATHSTRRRDEGVHHFIKAMYRTHASKIFYPLHWLPPQFVLTWPPCVLLRRVNTYMWFDRLRRREMFREKKRSRQINHDVSRSGSSYVSGANVVKDNRKEGCIIEKQPAPFHKRVVCREALVRHPNCPNCKKGHVHFLRLGPLPIVLGRQGFTSEI